MFTELASPITAHSITAYIVIIIDYYHHSIISAPISAQIMNNDDTWDGSYLILSTADDRRHFVGQVYCCSVTL